MPSEIDPDHFDGGSNLNPGHPRDNRTLADLIIELQKRFPEGGGVAEWYVNATGAPTIKGTIMELSSSVQLGVDVASANSDDPVGIMYDDGIADGQQCRLIVLGKAQVLLKNNTAGTMDNWVKTSDVAGRADATTSSPPGASPDHWQEIGHCGQTVDAGIDVLCWVGKVHFN